MQDKAEVVTMRYAGRLLARADACAKDEGVSRAEFIRGAVAAACTRSEAQAARRLRLAKAEEQARGVHTFPGGLRYEGALKDGLPHGHGTMTYPDGLRLATEFRGGELMEGSRGVMSFPGGKDVEGVIRDGDFRPMDRGAE